MKKSLYNRRFDCNHCGTLYRPKRSDQKFCSPSCRSSNHQMNKARGTAVKIAKPKADDPTTVKHLGNTFLGSAGANAATQLMEKVSGVHNSDILKAIQELEKTIQASNPRDQAILSLVQAIYKIISTPRSHENSWMHNID
jgi:hypothetical protein